MPETQRFKNEKRQFRKNSQAKARETLIWRATLDNTHYVY